ncbi:MAG: hypothetical protein KGJ86_04220 [Chloroflexota bacterium]|nr:hypothetical protein [Chloroflexota bacterium]
MSTPNEAIAEQAALHEIETSEYEPLVPIEIKLIVTSLVLGVLLLGLLFWTSSLLR